MFRRLHFDLWYMFRPPWDTGVSPPELLQHIADHAAGRAIDMGCGTGTNVLTLSQRGWTVTGVDFSPRAIRAARRRLRLTDRAADLLVADVTRPLQLTRTFDFVLDIGCFHSVPDQGGYLHNLAGLLEPGGHWLMYAFLKTPANGFGLAQRDLDRIQTGGLQLQDRRDGIDGREHPSAWFLFERRAAR